MVSSGSHKGLSTIAYVGFEDEQESYRQSLEKFSSAYWPVFVYIKLREKVEKSEILLTQVHNE